MKATLTLRFGDDHVVFEVDATNYGDLNYRVAVLAGKLQQVKRISDLVCLRGAQESTSDLEQVSEQAQESEKILRSRYADLDAKKGENV